MGGAAPLPSLATTKLLAVRLLSHDSPPAPLPSRSWLKNQPHPERPEAGAYGDYPDGYRKKHRTTPPLVQWMSGSLATKALVVDGPKWHW